MLAMLQNKGAQPYMSAHPIHGNVKLDDEAITNVAMTLARGSYLETAAAFAGVSRQTLYNWVSRGRKESERLEENPGADIEPSEELYLDLFDTVTRAQAEASARDLAIISYHADVLGDWRASAWRLERRQSALWANSAKNSAPYGCSGGWQKRHG